MRALYTLATLAIVAWLCLLMLKGWRSRQRRQADLP
ncbi:MAG: transporter, partial [Frankiales bacterium]